MKIKNITYPTKKKWLQQYWQKNVNIFLYAIENEEIKKEINIFRKTWCSNISTDPDELKEILQEMFLREALINRSEEKKKKLSFKVENGKYYTTASNGKIETKWEISNPFSYIDRSIGVPQAKLDLIEILSSIGEKEYEGFFEPYLFLEDEHKLVYPSKNILTATLHRLEFLRRLDYHILQKVKAEYFSLWPMFFYFALTDDIDFVLENVVNLIYPVRAYLIDDTLADSNTALVFRIYGACNVDEIINFFKDNRGSISKLNKFLGNKNVSGRSMKDFNYYIESRDGKELELAQNIKTNDLKNKKATTYEEIVLKNNLTQKNNKIDKKILQEPLNRVRVARTQIKKDIRNMTTISEQNEYEEIERLINKINTPRLI